MSVLQAVEDCANGLVFVKVLKNSGHIPSDEAMEKCFYELCDFIK